MKKMIENMEHWRETAFGKRIIEKNPGIKSEDLFVFWLHKELNTKFFSGHLRKISVKVSKGKWPRLLGKFTPGSITLSRSLLSEPRKLRFVLYHIMVHQWLYDMGLPFGHTVEFFTKELDYDDRAWVFSASKEGLLKGLDRDYCP